MAWLRSDSTRKSNFLTFVSGIIVTAVWLLEFTFSDYNSVRRWISHTWVSVLNAIMYTMFLFNGLPVLQCSDWSCVVTGDSYLLHSVYFMKRPMTIGKSMSMTKFCAKFQDVFKNKETLEYVLTIKSRKNSKFKKTLTSGLTISRCVSFSKLRGALTPLY